MHLRRAEAHDLVPVAKLAEVCQADGTRHCAYVSADAGSIASEIDEIPDWHLGAVVGLDTAGAIVFALLAEPDVDMGRVWWWGPFFADTVDEPVAAMHAAWSALPARLTDFAEHEICGDDRNVVTNAFASEMGWRTDEASAVLTVTLNDDTIRHPAASGPVREMTAADRPVIEQLHALHFAGAHLTPNDAATVDEAKVQLVATSPGGDVVAYLSGQVQADGAGYIDFLGTEPEHGGHGYATALVNGAQQAFRVRGCERTHLTVRESNTSARRVYRKAGFTEERLLRPHRHGFAIA